MTVTLPTRIQYLAHTLIADILSKTLTSCDTAGILSSQISGQQMFFPYQYGASKD